MIEPRGVTILDWFAATTGIVLCWSLFRPTVGYPFTDAFAALLMIEVILLLLPCALSAVIVVRQITFDREAHPAEYLPLLVAAWCVARSLPNIDTSINWMHQLLFNTPVSTAWTQWRWGVAAASLLLALSTQVIARQNSTRFLRIIVSAIGLIASFWGPLAVFASHFTLLELKGLNVLPDFQDAIIIEINSAVSEFPHLAIFGTTIALALLTSKGTRSTWPWTCWCTVFGAVIVLVGFFVTLVWRKIGLPIGWLVAAYIVTLTQLAVMVSVCTVMAQYWLIRMQDSARHIRRRSSL